MKINLSTSPNYCLTLLKLIWQLIVTTWNLQMKWTQRDQSRFSHGSPLFSRGFPFAAWLAWLAVFVVFSCSSFLEAGDMILTIYFTQSLNEPKNLRHRDIVCWWLVQVRKYFSIRLPNRLRLYCPDCCRLFDPLSSTELWESLKNVNFP